MSKPPFGRILKMGLQTLLGIKKQGFFIPYRYADRLNKIEPLKTYTGIQTLFDSRIQIYSDFFLKIDKYTINLTNIGHLPPPEPRWSQTWFPRLDGAVAYTMVREKRPQLIIEVGSGHSTRFIAKAIKDGDLQSTLIAIDPAPRATIGQLSINYITETVQNVGLQPFKKLAAGDILFIDSSHILMPGSDVDFLFNRVLPILPSGVILHIHDIFLPDNYPPEWEWRGYNEQLAVATLIQSTGFEILFSSHFATTKMTSLIKKSVVNKLEILGNATETSLWLKKK
jgi:predicted O-methyltransferase YrrM